MKEERKDKRASNAYANNIYKSQTDEHYTPEDILAVARDVLKVDQFDLDAASHIGNPTRANRIYTLEDDALVQDWTSTSLWCNPPFSKNLKFAQKLIEELPNIKKACWLSKTDSRPKWARLLIDNTVGVIVKKGYVTYGNAESSAPFGTCLYLFGDIDADHVRRVCGNTEDFKAFL